MYMHDPDPPVSPFHYPLSDTLADISNRSSISVPPNGYVIADAEDHHNAKYQNVPVHLLGGWVRDSGKECLRSH
jgi:hypothetical protein